ncbi:MAG: NTP transferase domain-containing protein [Oscillospiraceae bacterium]|nr:NTP transferase domain-containing protein [Oscillospiraceae bacterium]
MRISQIGGIIAAASKKEAFPLLQVGNIPIIRRIVITYQQAGIFPIVIITGADEEAVKDQLSPFGLIFIHNDNCENPELIDSAKIGLRYLKDKCDKIVFTPVNVPMFTPSTLKKLISSDAKVATPSYCGKGGHPIVIRNDVVDRVLSYCGNNGLRGAISNFKEERQWVKVDDIGITLSIHNEEQLQARLAEHNRSILNSFVRVSIEKERAFFDSRAKLLLYLIGDSGTVKKACNAMALSNAKAWNILNNLERELGYAIVERQQGGSRGGNTQLTEKGKVFITAYQRFEENVLRYAQSEFERLFEESNLV